MDAEVTIKFRLHNIITEQELLLADRMTFDDVVRHSLEDVFEEAIALFVNMGVGADYDIQEIRMI